MRLVRFLLRTVLGAALTWVWAVQQHKTDFVLITIACTGGLTLLLWVPLWWTIGTIVAEVAKRLMRAAGLVSKIEDSRHGERTGVEAGPATDSETAQAIQFIRLARRQGRSVDEIRENLLRAGWKPAEVDTLLADEPGGRANRP